jgi:hypothetical protein
VHNTQPWWFGTRGSRVTLHDDAYPRDPEHTDPYFAERDFARGQGWGLLGDDQQDATGVVALLTTGTDERAEWLAAGQALQGGTAARRRGPHRW